MALKNELVKKIPSNHPYIKYFKLLAKEIGHAEISNELNQLNNMDLLNNTDLLNKIKQTDKLETIINPSKEELNDDDTEEEN